MSDCQISNPDSENADPVRNQLHQAAKCLKTVRKLTCQAGVSASEGVVHCLAQVNLQLDSLCQQLRELECYQHPAAWPVDDLNARSRGNESHSRDASAQPFRTMQSNAIGTDRDNPIPSAVHFPGDNTAPSLNSILARLNSPADDHTNSLVRQRVKSLSDEDLLGLEMLNLVAAERTDFSNLGTRAATAMEQPDKTAPTGKCFAEAIYETALSGSDSLFSVESVPEECKPEDAPHGFVLPGINGSNREKLESLRERLQGIFSTKNQDLANSGNDPNGSQSLSSPEVSFHSACPQLPKQTSTNTLKNEFDSKKGGESMQTIQSTTGKKGNDGLMAGMATASFLKSLNLEEDEPASVQENPARLSAGNSPHSPPVPAAPQVKAETCTAPGDVDDYMKQLFHRLRGGEQTFTPQLAQLPPVSPGASTSAANQGTPPVMAEQSQEPVEPLKDGEFVPMSESRVQNLDISALRDIANQSTRSAIKVFAKHQKKTLYITQLAVVFGGVVGAVSFGALATGLGSLFYSMSVACICLSLFAGYRFFIANISSHAKGC